MTFSITLHVKPTGKGRPRFSRLSGRTYTPKVTVNAETEIKWLLQKASPPCFEGPVILDIHVCCARPKSAKKRKYPTVKPDLSNVLKLIEDACNGILFKDDSQVVSVTIRKVYGEKDCIVLIANEVV